MTKDKPINNLYKICPKYSEPNAPLDGKNN